MEGYLVGSSFRVLVYCIVYYARRNNNKPHQSRRWKTQTRYLIFKKGIPFWHPDFLARCVPSTSSSSTLVTVDVCTQKSLIEKGLRSFPAEHAAISFAGLGYLAFAVSRYFSFFAPQKNFTREGPTEYSNNSLVVFVIGVICPFILAGWCAWSKVLDNRYLPPSFRFEPRWLETSPHRCYCRVVTWRFSCIYDIQAI